MTTNEPTDPIDSDHPRPAYRLPDEPGDQRNDESDATDPDFFERGADPDSPGATIDEASPQEPNEPA